MLGIGKHWRQFFGDNRFRAGCGSYSLCFQANAAKEEVKALAEYGERGRCTDRCIQARPEPLPKLGTDIDGNAADRDWWSRHSLSWIDFAQLDHAHVTGGLTKRPEPAILLADLAQIALERAGKSHHPSHTSCWLSLVLFKSSRCM